MMICLDTNCVVYLVERNPLWGSRVVARLRKATAAGDTIAVCDLARAECLVGPLRQRDAALVADYQRFFASPQIQMLPLTVAVCERAAQLRAFLSRKIKLPDALHLAAAMEYGCGLFLTNDVQLTDCAAMTVEVIP